MGEAHRRPQEGPLAASAIKASPRAIAPIICLPIACLSDTARTGGKRGDQPWWFVLALN
jgi:hypothetical protein